MTKYSELSNFEIEHLIVEKIHGRKIHTGINRDIFIPKVCSNYYDVFNLMVTSEISLEKYLSGWLDGYLWFNSCAQQKSMPCNC